MGELLEKGRLGKLSAKEEKDLDTYERLGSLLGILHSKARQALNKRTADAWAGFHQFCVNAFASEPMVFASTVECMSSFRLLGLKRTTSFQSIITDPLCLGISHGLVSRVIGTESAILRALIRKPERKLGSSIRASRNGNAISGGTELSSSDGRPLAEQQSMFSE
jgi:hypothetical protein